LLYRDLDGHHVGCFRCFAALRHLLYSELLQRIHDIKNAVENDKEKQAGTLSELTAKLSTLPRTPEEVRKYLVSMATEFARAFDGAIKGDPTLNKKFHKTFAEEVDLAGDHTRFLRGCVEDTIVPDYATFSIAGGSSLRRILSFAKVFMLACGVENIEDTEVVIAIGVHPTMDSIIVERAVNSLLKRTPS